MKNTLTTVLVVVIFLCGLGILLYPTIADHWNARVQSRAVAVYDDRVSQLSETDQTALLQAAQDYNAAIARLPIPLATVTEEDDGYRDLLNVSGNGVMGYLEIPKIGVQLSVYHGIDESVLQVGIGHILGSSLPVGGVGTHAALSGHTGLPSATLLTNLDQLAIGDTFDLHMLGTLLRYQVDQILVVEPEDTSALAIDPTADLVTLVTCTPYGINSHRLLVRGRRIDVTPEEAAAASTEDTLVSDQAREIPAWQITLALIGLALVLRLLFHRRKPA